MVGGSLRRLPACLRGLVDGMVRESREISRIVAELERDHNMRNTPRRKVRFVPLNDELRRNK
jgi:hypothetical protein